MAPEKNPTADSAFSTLELDPIAEYELADQGVESEPTKGLRLGIDMVDHPHDVV